MKRFLITALALAFVLAYGSTVYALPAPVEKFKGGLKDVLISPLEIKDHTFSEVKASTIKPLGLVGGLIKGSGFMIKKAVSGAVDVATFPLK